MVKVHFSSLPITVTCWLPFSAYVILSPGAYDMLVWFELMRSLASMSLSLIWYAFWKNDFSHKSSQLSGIFWAAHVTFLIDQLMALHSQPLIKLSNTQNFEPSWKVRSRISGLIFKIVANRTVHPITSVTWAEALQRAWSLFFTTAMTSGWLACKPHKYLHLALFYVSYQTASLTPFLMTRITSLWNPC